MLVLAPTIYHFTLVAFTIMLSIMLMSLLIILLSSLKEDVWFVEATKFGFGAWVWTTKQTKNGSKCCLLILMPKNFSCFCFDVSILEGKSSSKILWYFFPYKLDWCCYIDLLLIFVSANLGIWFILWSLFLLKLLFISLNLWLWPCMKYCCHFWNGTTNCYLVFLMRVSRIA